MAVEEADGMTHHHLSLNNEFQNSRLKLARNELKSLVLQAAQGNCFSETALVPFVIMDCNYSSLLPLLSHDLQGHYV